MQTGINAMAAVTSAGASLGAIPQGLIPAGGPSLPTTHFSSLLSDAVGQVDALENQA